MKLTVNKQRDINITEEQSFISILETVSVETGERTLVREFDGRVQSPQFSPDGDSIIYNGGGLLYRYEFGSKKSYPIFTHYCESCMSNVLSPDGGEIAVTHFTYEDDLPRVYIIPVSGGVPRLITPMAPSIVQGWSPDGAFLAYCGERNGKKDIYSIPAGGGKEKRLTLDGVSDTPEFSSCGEYIYFSSECSGLMQLFRMDKNGENVIQITYDEKNNLFPHISPDGKYIAYLAYEPHEESFEAGAEIRLISSGGGEPQSLAQLSTGFGTMNVNSWSPDGERLAFISYRLI